MEGARKAEEKEKMNGGGKHNRAYRPLTTHEQKPNGVSRAAQPFISTLDTPFGFCYFSSISRLQRFYVLNRAIYEKTSLLGYKTELAKIKS